MFDYEIWIDTERDGTFGAGLGDVSNFVIDCSWTNGVDSAWDAVGAGSYLRLTLNNSDGRFSLADSEAAYYGKINRGTLIRVRISYQGVTTTMAVLKASDFRYLADASQINNASEYRLMISCVDPVAIFLKNDFSPSLRLDVRVDEALEEIFDKAEFIYPYDGSWFYIGHSELDGDDILYDYTEEDLIDFDEGYATLPFAGDNLDRGKGANIQSYVRDLMKAEFAGIFFWDVRSEQFKFFNRYHSRIVQNDPYIAKVSSHLFEMDDFVDIELAYGKDLVNDVTVNYYPREIGVAGSVVASSSATPITFSAQDTRTIKMRYSDPDNSDVSVGAIDMMNPIVGVDIIGNSERDGSGEDWSRFVIVIDVNDSAEYAEVTIYNRKVGDPVYLTTFQRRGTPVVSHKRETVNVVDGESRRLYDKSIMSPENCRLIADNETATDYANFLLNTRKTPDMFFESVRLIAKSSEIAVQIKDRIVGDTITIKDSRDVSTIYMIVGERHTVRIGDGVHMVDWILRPVKYGGIFIIDTSSLDGTDSLL